MPAAILQVTSGLYQRVFYMDFEQFVPFNRSDRISKLCVGFDFDFCDCKDYLVSVDFEADEVFFGDAGDPAEDAGTAEKV